MASCGGSPETGVDVADETIDFVAGDHVVHPHHGAGLIVSRGHRHALGVEREYLEIELADRSLRILVPSRSAHQLGLRPVVDHGGLEQVAAILADQPTPLSGNWSARHKHYRQLVKTGDVRDLAAVVRDLAIRATQSELPTNDRELYQRSRHMLASELGYALGHSPEHAEAYIDQHLNPARQRGPRPDNHSAHPARTTPGITPRSTDADPAPSPPPSPPSPHSAIAPHSQANPQP
jgi:CarD family transcriptional regulator